MRIAIVDTLYGDFIKTCPVDHASTYEAELQRILELSFGTFDAYSRGLRANGWETLDIIANHHGLQKMWALENGGYHRGNILETQLLRFNPDVILCQDLSLAPQIPQWKNKLMAGQCSCPMPNEANIKRFNVIFSSLPTHLPRFEAMGVRGIYNPLGFDEIVLQRMGPVSGKRSGVVFVGGVGSPSHWKYGMEVLETVARHTREFSWFGYGVDTVPKSSPLRGFYRGEAWGLSMYERMAKAQIVINRHGEVSEGFANNMRLFEATGVGSMLLTDYKFNLGDFFSDGEVVSYASPMDAVEKCRYYLDHPDEARTIAEAGQRRTLKDHSYTQRMKTISDTLKEML